MKLLEITRLLEHKAMSRYVLTLRISQRSFHGTRLKLSQRYKNELSKSKRSRHRCWAIYELLRIMQRSEIKLSNKRENNQNAINAQAQDRL